MSTMSIFGRVALSAATATLLLTFVHEAGAEDMRNLCYMTKIKGEQVYLLGDTYRLGLLSATRRAWGDGLQPGEETPTDPTRCKGEDGAVVPSEPPTAENYYGNIVNKRKFLDMAATACDGTVPNQYFSMGSAIYYRNCTPGQRVGYIYFWGLADGVKSTCIPSTYPELYAHANAKKDKPVTFERMTKTFRGGLTIEDKQDYALGNAMAAIQIAEAARDYLVFPENYMLIDMLDEETGPVQIIGGRCVPGTPKKTCQNKKGAQDGEHPIAWGGALDMMMTNSNWGASNGATSEFGMTFEANKIVSWLLLKKKITIADVDKCEKVQRPFAQFPDATQDAVRALFDPLFR